MKSRILILFLVVILISLSGCQGNSADSPTQPAQIQDLPELEAGTAGVYGTAFSEINGEPLGDTIVRLAEVVCQGEECAFVLDAAFSPGAITDENGKFVISNAPAIEYLVVIGNVDVYQGYEIVQDSSGEATRYILKEDEYLDLGELRVKITGEEY